jgi:hypothetical protein
MRHAKAANIIDLHDQLTWAYNVIAFELIKNIDFSDESISIMTFLKNLEIKKNIWHRIYIRKSIASKTKFEFFYQINSSSSVNFSYDQFNQIYTSRQYRQSLENISETRNYQKFQSSDNAYQKNKISFRSQKSFDEYNQQIRFSNVITFDQIQSSSFETQSMRNQVIFAWRQNVSQENIIDQTQDQLSATNAERSSLNQFNIEEREQYQDQRKRDQFRKFYDNREQLMKTYVAKKNQNAQKNDEQDKFFENIDSIEKNDRDDQNDQFVYNLNINSSKICKKCDVERKTFKSNNAFHDHIKSCLDDKIKLKKAFFAIDIDAKIILIVKSRAKKTSLKEYDFRSYQYAIAWMQMFLKKSIIKEITNTRCAIFLMNTKYLAMTIFRAEVQNMLASINVRDIKNALHQFTAYVILNLYLIELINDKKIKEHIRKEFHIMNDLKCKILMRLNIMISKEMTINLSNKFFVILICENLIVSIRINLKSNSRIRRIIHSKKSIKIFSNSIINIFTYLRDKKLSLNRDFLFEFNNNIFTKFLNDLDEFYTHVCDCNLTFVHVKNALISSMMISSRTRLNILIEYEKEKCFQMKFELHEWIVICNETKAEANFS